MKKIFITIIVAGLIAISSSVTIPTQIVLAVPPIADNSITSPKIRDGQVMTSDLADNAITTEKIEDGTILKQDIAIDALSSSLRLHTVPGDSVVIPAGESKQADASCPTGELLTGGGFAAGGPVIPRASFPVDSDTWGATAQNTSPDQAGGIRSFVVCVLREP